VAYFDQKRHRAQLFDADYLAGSCGPFRPFAFRAPPDSCSTGAVRQWTPQEREVLESLIDGDPMPAISQRIHRPLKEAQALAKTVMAKAGVATRMELRVEREAGRV